MKSYLHGLTAKGAGSAIRPIVTPFYAGSGEQEAGALVEEGLARRPETEVAPKPRRSGLSAITGALDAASAGLIQSVSKSLQKNAQHQIAADRQEPVGSQRFVPLVGDAHEERRERLEARGEETDLEGSPVKASPRTETSTERTLLPQTVMTIKATQAMAGRPAPQAPIEQPDQIEIHIGRIEVTAVTPAAAAAPRPPQKKSLDLGEYLKGRDGRAS